MMRGLSLWQPYATGIALRLKTIETRGRKTHVRGELAIHAAIKSFAPMQTNFDVREDLWKSRDRIKGFHDTLFSLWENLPHGAIVAIAELYDCSRTEVLRYVKPFGEEHWGDYDDGRYGWALKEIRPLKEPVQCKGRQGFFFLPEDVERKVRAQL